jgi:hypothetical protein
MKGAMALYISGIASSQGKCNFCNFFVREMLFCKILSMHVKLGRYPIFRDAG